MEASKCDNCGVQVRVPEGADLMIEPGRRIVQRIAAPGGDVVWRPMQDGYVVHECAEKKRGRKKAAVAEGNEP